MTAVHRNSYASATATSFPGLADRPLHSDANACFQSDRGVPLPSDADNSIGFFDLDTSEVEEMEKVMAAYGY